ncbi:MAG TPA: TAT-variant-translocated molybdopterin oxidoreductase [Chthoniobacterales bacterium]|jgi:molybdopterin-containing oxidoreductase family iron-sulfur binding subunit
MNALSKTEVRAELDGKSGPQFWRSLDELADRPEFREFLEREFPAGASEWPNDQLSRRHFLGLLGATLALAGVTGCTRAPADKIVPYVKQPENVVPGQPLYYATAMPLHGRGRGILVKTEMGRPIKIEGNPAHPDSLGATDAITQAAVLSLWDPDRSLAPYLHNRISSWPAFQAELLAVLQKMDADGGASTRILAEPDLSPTLARQRQALLAKYPRLRWHEWSPAGATASAPKPDYDLGKADLIVAIGSDFLSELPGSLRYTRQFAVRRRVLNGKANPNRLYVLESTPTLTGAMADERLPAAPDRIAAVLHSLGAMTTENLNAAEKQFAEKLRADLAQFTGSKIVIVGASEPPEVQTLAATLGARFPAAPPDQLTDLARNLQSGNVKQLFILGANPVYAAPFDLKFREAVAKATFAVHLALYRDETSACCRWHLPQAHFLETWSDILASDGTPSILQPAISPLYSGRSEHELLAMMLGDFQPDGYEIVRETWRAGAPNDDFEPLWRESTHDGVVRKLSAPAAGAALVANAPTAPRLEANQTYLLFRLDPTIGDGRWSNNGWLQELPKPLTKLTWDNAALIAPAMADRLGLTNGDVVELRCNGATVEAPIWILPGQADRCVTIHLGYGRSQAGSVGNGCGFDAYQLRHSTTPWLAVGLEIKKTGRRRELATTQHHHSMEGRDIIRVASAATFRGKPNFASASLTSKASLLPETPPLGPGRYAWGMTVDLGTCTGCNACISACQAENNIPIVGKRQVLMNREMHWIRIDRYFEGSADTPRILHMPVLCMQCEKAPCEIVCPVAATVHDDEGLNAMVYNRCVGTRFCSNNCPYKVRRFNFLEYSAPAGSAFAQRQNPNVTVRRRGVMEKCTYCLQRITAARIASDLQSRAIRDGEIVTACQQACPAEAIVFGDIQDRRSRVSQRKSEPVNYSLLDELNTKPRTTYLARVTNPA